MALLSLGVMLFVVAVLGIVFLGTDKKSSKLENLVFILLFLLVAVLGVMMIYYSGYHSGNGVVAVDRGSNALKTCKIYGAHVVGNSFNKVVVEIFMGKDKKSRLYVFPKDKVPPTMFVKTKDGEYVSFPNPGKYVLKGCK